MNLLFSFCVQKKKVAKKKKTFCPQGVSLAHGVKKTQASESF
jgi:hypothetical protein